MKSLGIIPARGGSKGIPGKNLRIVSGKALISYPLDEGQKSSLLARLVVSTDSAEIKEYVENNSNAQVISRPADFATDRSPVIDSVLHVLDELEKAGEHYDLVVLLQPTSPFWRAKQLDELLGMFEDESTEAVVSVIPTLEMHPSKMYSLSGDSLLPYLPHGETIRRQELAPVYFRNGCFYAVRVATLRRERSLMPSNKKPYLMDPEWFLTIDIPRELKLAEIMAEEWNNAQSE